MSDTLAVMIYSSAAGLPIVLGGILSSLLEFSAHLSTEFFSVHRALSHVTD
jgi:hypothetical protein